MNVNVTMTMIEKYDTFMEIRNSNHCRQKGGGAKGISATPVNRES